MIALPKAISHGSNGAGGGALTALRGISAAKAEPTVPAVIASAAAIKTSFFMTIPIRFQKSVRFRRPPGTSDHPTATKFRNLNVICRAPPVAGSKKDEHCRLFGRYDGSS